MTKLVNALLVLAFPRGARALLPLRPPCAPLSVVSPYQSIWSCSDNLYDSWPVFWNGATNGAFGMINVDGTVYRWMGPEQPYLAAPACTQARLEVFATTTSYQFDVGATGVQLDVNFTTSAFDLDNDDATHHDWPVTYVQFQVSALDGFAHHVQVYLDTSAESVVSDNSHEVMWGRAGINDLPVSLAVDLFIGTTTQAFGSSTTNDRVDWGHAHLAVIQPSKESSIGPVASAMASANTTRHAFVDPHTGGLGVLVDDPTGPRAANNNWPVLAAEIDLSLPGSDTLSSPSTAVASATGTFLLALDLDASMHYFGTNLPPYWKVAAGTRESIKTSKEPIRVTSTMTTTTSAVEMLGMAATQVSTVLAAAHTFDAKLAAEHTSKGGESFATLTSLVYRQVTGALEKVSDPVSGAPWLFMKEISSDGDVSTVDVIYPAAPFFLATGNVETLKRLLLPVLVYAANATQVYGEAKAYDLDWAPHHLGQWPLCNLPADQQEQMPLEESGNLLLMVAAIVKAQQQGSNADPTTDPLEWLKPFWGVLNRYAAYAQASLPDPQDQLCTDDFAGPSPHNTNLAAKGIVALAAWAEIARMNPTVDASAAEEDAKAYAGNASALALEWQKMALDVNGTHYKLQFDLPGTWSQKYNFLFQELLQLDPKPFPPEVVQLEEAWYAANMNQYGIPLDSRQEYTKHDWSMWVAAMGTDDQFHSIVEACFAFANKTMSRVPLGDWTHTSTPQSIAFKARPVMGGIYAKLLL